MQHVYGLLFRLCGRIGFDPVVEHIMQLMTFFAILRLRYAGSDFLLMPSRWWNRRVCYALPGMSRAGCRRCIICHSPLHVENIQEHCSFISFPSFWKGTARHIATLTCYVLYVLQNAFQSLEVALTMSQGEHNGVWHVRGRV